MMLLEEEEEEEREGDDEEDEKKETFNTSPYMHPLIVTVHSEVGHREPLERSDRHHMPFGFWLTSDRRKKMQWQQAGKHEGN